LYTKLRKSKSHRSKVSNRPVSHPTIRQFFANDVEVLIVTHNESNIWSIQVNSERCHLSAGISCFMAG
jgi:hypothetical protein